MKGSNVRLFECLIAVVAMALSSFAEEPVQPRVSVSSEPSGATVLVDGEARGTAPTVLFDVAPGRHRLTCRLAGYEDWDGYFDTAEGPFVEKSAVLSEVKGLLLLKTDPPGCDVQIDGLSVGQTPRLVTDLSVRDQHVVKFRKAGYQDQTISVKFNGREPQVREESMVLSSGTIIVTSEPSGAEVTVNGIVRGKTPLTVREVPRGRATVKFRLEGYGAEERELSINPGDVQNLPIVLQGLPGTLHLASVPDGARFYVNGEARGKGPISLPGLKPGDYLVRAELDGYATVSKTVTLANGASASEEFRLSNVMGRLEVRTSPVGAQVMLDGHVVGTTKSADPSATVSDVLAIENVMEGEHTLVTRLDGYRERTRHPKIRSGKTSQANVRLERLFIPNVEIETSRGSYRGVLVSKTSELVTIEVRLGINQSFSTDEIRKLTFLDEKTAK